MKPKRSSQAFLVFEKAVWAAFGVSDPAQGTERFVIVAETRVTADEDLSALKATIIERVATAIGVPPDAVVLSGPGSVPKTSSGKIKRGATRDAYTAGQLLARPPVALQWARLGARACAGYLQRLFRRTGQAAFTAWGRGAAAPDGTLDLADGRGRTVGSLD